MPQKEAVETLKEFLDAADGCLQRHWPQLESVLNEEILRDLNHALGSIEKARRLASRLRVECDDPTLKDDILK